MGLIQKGVLLQVDGGTKQRSWTKGEDNRKTQIENLQIIQIFVEDMEFCQGRMRNSMKIDGNFCKEG